MRILLRTISGDLTRITLWRNKKEKACDSMLFLFPLERRNRMLFFAERKASKELQAFGLAVSAGRKCIPSAPDTCLHSVNSCNPRRNTPNGQRVQSGSLAPAGASFPVAQNFCTANVGLPSEARANNCWEPCVCASQQHDESPRQRLDESFGAFLLSEKSTHLLLWKGETACFSLQKEKHQKNCKPAA